MKKTIISLLSLAFLISCSTISKSGSAVKMRKYEEKRLENGLTILFVPDPSLPYVAYSMMLMSGASEEPAAKAGLASLTASLLDQGSSDYTAIQIAQQLGQYGAQFSASVDEDFSSFSTSGISTYSEPLLDLFSEILLKPAFKSEEIQRLKRRRLAELERRVDDPSSFTGMAWQSVLYGAHPYGSPEIGRRRGLNAITKKDIYKFYLAQYRPNNAILAVIGQVDDELKKKVIAKFGEWKPYENESEKLPELKPIEGRQITLIHKPGAVQAQLRLGHYGIQRTSEDFLALRLANTVLGGAFKSRLNDRIRKDLGLTYSIRSSWDAKADRGPFEVSTFTKNESVGQVVEEVLKILEEFKKTGITEAELKSAQAYLKGVFPRAIETPELFAYNLMVLKRYGLTEDYLKNYMRDIDRLNIKAVNEAVKKHLDPANLKIVVYGDRRSAEPALKKFGSVQLVSTETILK